MESIGLHSQAQKIVAGLKSLLCLNMAIYKLQPSANRIAGSRGGLTFQRTAVNFVIRKRAVPKQRRTATQARAKNLFASRSQNWRVLSSGNKAIWDSERSNYVRVNSLGNNYIMNPNQMQIGSNVNQNLSAVAPLNQPAAGATPIQPFPDFVSIEFASQEAFFQLVLNPVDPNTTVAVFATAPLSPGTVVPPESNFKLIHIFGSGDFTDVNIWDELNLVWPLSPATVGQRIYGGFRTIDLLTGQHSAMSTLSGIIQP